MPPDDSKLVMVDNEWHIFSAYRAIYGIAYPEFIQLPEAADGETDTLFFPGCSLVSYAPELTRCVGQWLNSTGYRWALSVECCGSPLMSAGLFERSKALRLKLLEQVRAAGITRILTVCPGCGEELAEVMGDEIDIVPLPELMLDHVSRGEILELPAQGGSEATELTPFSVTFFDSCHDRFDTRHGRAIRSLLKAYLPKTAQFEMEHHGKETLCCGAGGAVAAYDAEITQRRVWRVIEEAQATEASTLVTTCPTCTYTIAQALLQGDSGQDMSNHNYLELIFGQSLDWPAIFGQLEAMWSGEYGPWLAETFF
jgi:Fe-S oxidoreductase